MWDSQQCVTEGRGRAWGGGCHVRVCLAGLDQCVWRGRCSGDSRTYGMAPGPSQEGKQATWGRVSPRPPCGWAPHGEGPDQP